MKSRITLLALLIYSLLSSVAYAQKQTPWVINDIPPNESNDRFYNDIVSVNRPALSIVGFDNINDHSKGYGLKQILNQAYVSNLNEQKKMILDILDIARDDEIILNPTSIEDYRENSNILQYRAFEVLASYVLEQNGVDSTMSNSSLYGIPIRSHATALAAFKNDILALSSAGKLANVVDDDHVLELRTFSNIARALDLYLALENAYKHWDYAEWNNSNSQVLLTYQQKYQLLGHFNDRLIHLREYHVFKNAEICIGTPPICTQTPVSEHKFEPGNRPLKGFMALGYASFATQNVGLNNYEYQEVLSWWTKARDAGGSPTTNNRDKKWMYQSDNGQRFWAEGVYYLNFALTDVLPFWHAVRANNLLGSVSDPFNNSWFLNPVEWLADTSTPDGLTVPLDDGNKHSISAAPLLRWSSVYGNATVGMKFNQIYETKNSYFDLTPTSSPLKELYRHGFQTYLIELAMPKTNNTLSIDYNIVDSSEQQFILRNTDSHNRNHFLLLNTEHGKAIPRGEGHEQADQLQFLYNVNEESILADAGYDKGSASSNSSWNKFYFNNGLSFSNHNDGGLPSPYIYAPELRKASDHNEAFDRVFLDHGKIKVMSAKNAMDHYTVISQKFNSQYARSILFIEEDVSNNVPNYVIDFNTNIRGHLSYAESIRHTVSLRYIVGVPQAVSTSYNNWNTFNFNSGKLAIYMQPVEWSFEGTSNPNNFFDYEPGFMIREYNRDPYPASRISIPALNNSSRSWTSASVIWFDDNYPNFTPVRTDGFFPGEYLRPFSAWAIPISNDIVDVYAKRTYTQGINTNNGFHSFFVPLINKSLSLLQNKDYGFVRLIKQGDIWIIDEDYKLNIEISAPNVTIQGPSQINQGNITQFNAVPSGGSGTYTSYSWQIKYENETEWTNLYNSNQAYYHVSNNTINFELIATVVDSDNQAGYSPIKYVEVFPGHIQIVDPGTETFSEPEEDALYLEFKMHAAYPNPFNPVTQIQYTLPEISDVRIEVFNVMGQKVATLENSRRGEGTHSVSFNALNLSSGIYMVRFTAFGLSGSRFSDLQTISLVK